MLWDSTVIKLMTLGCFFFSSLTGEWWPVSFPFEVLESYLELGFYTFNLSIVYSIQTLTNMSPCITHTMGYHTAMS